MTKYKFSKRSLNNMKNVHPDLIKIANEAIKYVDFTIIEGHRSIEQQKENIKKGVSQTLKSKHCETPARAMDIIPYPFKGWNDTKDMDRVTKVILECARKLGIPARRGSDWNMNDNTGDEKFYDGPHIELMNEQELEAAKKRYGNNIKY